MQNAPHFTPEGQLTEAGKQAAELARAGEDLSQGARRLFRSFANEAPHWSGTPMVDGLNNEEKGYLTDLKKKGYLTTFESDGIQWVQFTPNGILLAASYGIEL